MMIQIGSTKAELPEVMITRNFDASRELVWKTWTDPNLFE
jgi:uncharacterized protein YndB with AHSA1/START domain